MNPFARNLILTATIAAVGLVGYFSFVYDPAPVANLDRASTDDIASTEIYVLLNDTDRGDGAMRVTGVGDPDHGIAVVDSSGSHVIYTPDPGFGGEDRFVYEIVDEAGQMAQGQVVVDVTFTSPDFHKRSSSASLQEMLSEPATSMYGSTIDVFVFRDSDGNLREITIAGHADSITCSIASGAFASALIESGLGEGDFLLAGAGRISVPVLSEEERLRFLADPDVEEYDTLRRELETVRFLVSRDLFPEQEVAATYGWDLEEGQARLEELETRENVRAYLLSAVVAESAQAFLEQARELQETSGLLRLHELRFDVVSAVHDRLKEASKAGKSEVLTFSDLDPGGEAVVYTPMLMIGSGEPVELEIPVGRFSPDGFRAAAKQHRSALEKAIENSAQRRYEHATRLLESERSVKLQCDAATTVEREELISTQTCDQDECGSDTGSLRSNLRLGDNRITFGEYCDVNNPQNLITSAQWQENALEILDRMKRLRDEQDSLNVDALTHAALIDSMLRDWALPIPDAQAAFDNWRTVGRTDAWQALTTAMAEQGVARAAISGESVLFDVSLVGDTLTIRPLLAVDLARSRVVVDPQLGAVAAVAPWELREISELPAEPIESGSTVSILLSDSEGFKEVLIGDPARTMEALLDELFALLPEQNLDGEKRREFMKLGHIHQIEQELRPLIQRERAKSFESQEDVAKSLPISSFAARAIRDNAGFTPEFVAETFHLNSLLLVRLLGETESAGWRFAQVMLESNAQAQLAGGDRLRSALRSAGVGTENLNFDAIRGLESELFGSTLQEVFNGAMSQMNAVEARTVMEHFAKPAPSDLNLAALPELPPQTVLDRLTAEVEIARTALLQRQAVDKALSGFDETGRVSMNTVVKAIEGASTGTAPENYFSWDSLLSDIRSMRSDSRSGSLNSIQGSQLATKLGEEVNRQDTLLTNLKPRLVALRYGRDQDAIAARLLFDEGAYLQAFDHIIAEQTPLSLYDPNLAWEVLDPNLKAIPDRLRLLANGDSVVLEVKVGGKDIQLLRFNGLVGPSFDALVGAEPQALLPWNEGDPLWEQVLLTIVPSRPEAQKLAGVFAEDELRLATLKAMVYACAVPANHLLNPGGRCSGAEGSTELHDRVSSGAFSFQVPEQEQLESALIARFTSEGAWRSHANLQ